MRRTTDSEKLINIPIPEELHTDLKMMAVEEKTTVRKVVEQSLEDHIYGFKGPWKNKDGTWTGAVLNIKWAVPSAQSQAKESKTIEAPEWIHGDSEEEARKKMKLAYKRFKKSRE